MCAQRLEGRGSFLFRGVVMSDGGRPVSGQVRVFSGEQAKFTRKFESAFAFELSPGMYRIEVSSEGYVSQQHKFAVRASGGMTHNFPMRPTARAAASLPDAPAPQAPPAAPDEPQLEILPPDPEEPGGAGSQ